MLFVRVYARAIYFLLVILLKLVYVQPRNTEFSTVKHDKMIRANKVAEKIFNAMVSVISKPVRYDYTIQVHYEGCKLLIRPFLYSEIIMVSGRWEPYVKQVLDAQVGQNDVIVEVGASIGVYAVPLAKKVKKVLAFEPHPKTSEILENSIKLNRLDNIVLIKKIAGDSKRKVSYSLSMNPSESGVIKTSGYTSTEHRSDTLVTECIDLDSALATEYKIDWLLIDAEGFEANVIKGARSILTRFSPKIIFESFVQNIDEVRKILRDEGYSISQIYSIYYYAAKV